MESKKEIRKEVINQLSLISKPDYEHLSYQIAQTLYNDEVWKHSKVIGVTISRFPEVDTYQIIRKAWELGKIVVIPKCYREDRSMVFRVLSNFSQLECVYSGLYEPIESKTKQVQADEIDLLIVPGLAYTLTGYRLGFGGGYYDRFLQSFKGDLLSLAFHQQFIRNFPIEPHDIPIKRLITEKEIVTTNA